MYGDSAAAEQKMYRIQSELALDRPCAESVLGLVQILFTISAQIHSSLFAKLKDLFG